MRKSTFPGGRKSTSPRSVAEEAPRIARSKIFGCNRKPGIQDRRGARESRDPELKRKPTPPGISRIPNGEPRDSRSPERTSLNLDLEKGDAQDQEPAASPSRSAGSQGR
ncbi:hypothetical protein KM043_017725 [Ampulex compressa]|nr:hypothetical protein KM043_017725 [Ampulex compressa]